MTKEQKAHLVDILNEVGLYVQFSTSISGSSASVNLSPLEVVKYMEDPEAFEAAYCGVSKEHYIKWRDHTKNPRCSALTREGRPCNGSVPTVYLVTDYRPEGMLCFAHGGPRHHV